MFTKKQLEVLAPYESYFESAVVANYVRNIPADKIQVIKDTWEEASGEKIREKLTCGVCLLNFIKRVGTNYYKDKKALKTKKTNGKTKKESKSSGDVPGTTQG